MNCYIKTTSLKVEFLEKFVDYRCDLFERKMNTSDCLLDIGGGSVECERLIVIMSDGENNIL